MRVLHVGKFYPPVSGGMERVLQLLCEQERPAVDSRVLVANTGAATVHDDIRGVPVTRVTRWAQIGAVAVCPTLPFWLRRMQGDVTVIHEPNPVALIAAIVTPRLGPLVVWFHSEVVRPAWRYRLFYRPFLRAVLRRAARIVVSSPALAEHAAELQDFRDKCVVIPFGVDLERFERTPAIDARVAALRAERGETPVALFVGRLVPYKGLRVLLEALQPVEARVVLVGDGPLRGELETVARRLGVAERVEFLGGVTEPELVVQYHACDFFVLPSITRAEAFGVVQLEAMTCGKPVISTSVRSGVPWVNVHGRTGLVVPPGDIDALAEAMGVLAADPSTRRELGVKARARAEQEFTLERMAARTADLYRDVRTTHA